MIERIIIENFKSIRRLELDLKPLNILIGANGAGKSNFLSFFKLIYSTVGSKFSEYNNNIDSLLYFGRKTSPYMMGEARFGGFYKISFRIVPQENSNFGFISENNIFNSLGIKDNEHHLDPIFSSIETQREHFNGIVYHFQDTSKDSSMKKFADVEDNRFLNENGSNLAAYLYYIQEKYPQILKGIEQQIRSVASFFDHFELAPRRLNEKEIQIEWKEKGFDSFRDGHYFSDGTLRFIALTTLLLQPDLPKTIIIDEPELGLHPFAINKIAAMMKTAAAKGSQIIVSTQSVDLVDNFEPEDVIAVDRKDNESTFKRLESE
ncbi:MAG TPA: AAA family ATPase, partial [Pyrinomonadaceae bacterium]